MCMSYASKFQVYYVIILFYLFFSIGLECEGPKRRFIFERCDSRKKRKLQQGPTLYTMNPKINLRKFIWCFSGAPTN
jgi:hypothetical protein